YVSICSPNSLHDAHVRLALRVGAHAICEKPLVINPWNLDQLEEIESESAGRIYTVLQLRLHPRVRELKAELSASPGSKYSVDLAYVTRRGSWYHHSWKGDEQRSGGLAMNIGIHFFDLLLWLFGRVERSLVHVSTPGRMAGALELERARVRWFLSVDAADLPESIRRKAGHSFRCLTIDGEEIDLSAKFSDLHTEVYREILAGYGCGIAEARPSIELVYNVRNSRETHTNGSAHPLLAGAARL
ncbi:MAG TPA: Gfo/Idh/MocA family oxidoreductase, partial [Planctomycetaceae bacterium]|nr:Gfo/Idh/MocA family oxidoreductase [Planctomycetaceae bacterium]